MSTTTHDIHAIEGDAEIQRFADIVSMAFTTPFTESAAWFDKLGLAHIRVAGRGANVAGGLAQIPMGQFFGGKSVTMVGIAGVAVAPEHRGRGVAGELVRSTLKELYDGGAALSALYPSTVPIYRACGYEQAGGRFKIRVRPGDLGNTDRDPPARRVTDADLAAVETLYRECAQNRDGYLDRRKYIWDRVRLGRGPLIRGFVVVVDGAIEAYAFAAQTATDHLKHDVVATDVCARSERAARRILAVLASNHSLAVTVSWHGGANDALLGLVREPRCDVVLGDHFMLRIISVERALLARGWPAFARGRVELEIEDEIIPENSGRFVLTVEGGQAHVERGGSGSVRMHVRGLAALYAGFRSPRDLALAGLCAGDLDAAAAVFPLGAPAMPDHF